jgi:hypothetical protein
VARSFLLQWLSLFFLLQWYVIFKILSDIFEILSAQYSDSVIFKSSSDILEILSIILLISLSYLQSLLSHFLCFCESFFRLSIIFCDFVMPYYSDSYIFVILLVILKILLVIFIIFIKYY